jgi:hypothetical protein
MLFMSGVVSLFKKRGTLWRPANIEAGNARQSENNTAEMTNRFTKLSFCNHSVAATFEPVCRPIALATLDSPDPDPSP